MSVTPNPHLQYKVVCQTDNINTPLLGTYFTDNRFIAIILYIIFIYRCITNYLLHRRIFPSGWWFATQVPFVINHNQEQVFLSVFWSLTYTLKEVLFLKFNILYLYNGSKNFCSISVYVLFVTPLPEDGHMGRRDK
jgi:hypothetical protein